MNTSIKSMLTAVFLMAVMTVQAQEKIIQLEQLPQSAQSFIKTYYPKATVSYITMENEFLAEKEYKVVLTDGVKIEFDGKGNWTEVDAKLHAVPTNIVPASIHAHIKKSFPNNNIVQISKSSRKYEVELTNGLDLEYNKKGKFVRIDD
ncbi:PepSY-like domain-containing protein [Sphingobacterium lumbrici]|uniref:PepSY-like domain-containing protein n=1 Tax=Sphingobacterium lumbrici TaxID=2559600 RepID=UPI0011287649|nr:PepSY-like domain-containing protein [Sphingobacterium lumbrici]